MEELRYPKSLYRIKFSFQENPYFQNEVVVKEYQLNITGKVNDSQTLGSFISVCWLDRIGYVLNCSNSSRV